MKRYLLLVLVSLAGYGLIARSMAGLPVPRSHHRSISTATAFTRSVWLDGNRVKIRLDNRGNWDDEGGRANGAAYWPDTVDRSNNVVVYDAGPWVVGKYHGMPRMGLVHWRSNYSAGPAIGGKAAMLVHPEDSMRYRPYKISVGDDAASNPDYREWPTDLGAPIDSQGKPLLLGDQTVWTVFNNLDTTAPDSWWRTHMPLPALPVVIQQAAYERAARGTDTLALLGNVAFLEWTIINVGDAAIESCYVSLWTNIDFNAPQANRTAVDTTLQLGYLWQSLHVPDYVSPRAVGFLWLYGPSVPSPGNQAVFKGQVKNDHRNLPLSSFWGIEVDASEDTSFLGPPYSMSTTWNVARGLDKLGCPILDPLTHQVTKFPYSGDPVTGTGWLASYTGAGVGFNLFSGPFTLAAGDTQWVMMALIPVRAPDRLQCVTLLRQAAVSLRAMPYSTLTLTGVAETILPAPTSMCLQQNYPNPFNPKTEIKYTIAGTGGLGLRGSNTRLVVYDLLGREVATLVDEPKQPGSYQVTFDASNLASGLYIYRLSTPSFAQSRKMLVIK